MSLESIDRYRVIRHLGAGGMGDVYLAFDPVLDREVSIKLLPERTAGDEDARRRLLQEARLAARLDHANICSIHEVGEEGGRPFIVMQYVEGRSLDEILKERRLDLEESLDLAVQIVSALAEAHRRDIVHRDVKPSNVLVTPRGAAKVLDFGISKLVEDAEAGSADLETLARTETGMLVGSVPYMSPEQARGESVDPRTDIFSFGITLYEMVHGRHPFSGSSRTSVLAAILTRPPDPPDIADAGLPPGLGTILDRALAKEREDRYASADELLEDLEDLRDRLQATSSSSPGSGRRGAGGADAGARVQVDTPVVSDVAATRAFDPGRWDDSGVPAAPGGRRRTLLVGMGAIVVVAVTLAVLVLQGVVPWAADRRQVGSVAVLPLVDVSDDAELAFLADGLADRIIARLATLPDLRVMSRQAAFGYRGPDVDPLEVGRELGVDAVLLGRIGEQDGQLDVRLELVDARHATVLWAGIFDGPMSDLVSLQSEMALEISAGLRQRPSGEEVTRIARHETDDAEANRLFLHGQHNYQQSTEEAIRRAIGFYEQAVDRDPEYALAWASMSLAYNTLAANYVAPTEVLREARAAGNRALALDDALPEAHYAVGNIAFLFDWDWETAEARFRRAVELNPSFALVRTSYGALLWTLGRHDESIAQHRRAVELDPTGMLTNSNLAIAYYFARRYPEAVRQSEEILELQPDLFFTYVLLGWVHNAAGRHEDARVVLERGVQRTGTQGRERELLRMRLVQAHTYAHADEAAAAWRILEEAEAETSSSFVWPTELAAVHATLGDADEAFAWLERAYEVRTPWAAFAGVDPRFDPLRTDPRFPVLMERIGVPASALAAALEAAQEAS